MFCPNCGTQINDDATICGNCGAPVNAQAPQQPQAPQAPQDPQAPQQPAPGFVPQAPVLTMKWFKFLIYFLLFASAIINAVGGITALTGAQYTAENGENVSKLVYAIYPNLKTIDVVYGVLCIALGAYQIFVRFQLSSYKAKAPVFLMAMYIATAVVTAIYSFGVIGVVPNEIVGHSELIGEAVGAIVVGIVMLFLNKIYFDKRKDLFVK